MKIYLAGPMTGYPHSNFAAFDYAAALLRAEGHEVFSPAEGDRKIMGWPDNYIPTDQDISEATASGKLSYRTCLALDTAYICREAEEIRMLRGWEKSAGVGLEKHLGELLKMPVTPLTDRYNI